MKPSMRMTAVSSSQEARPARTEAQKYWTVIVCGIALLSDGYCASSIGTVITILRALYPAQTKSSNALALIGSISFIGTIVGQLTFGFVTDLIGRKKGMLLATAILILWTAMTAGAYGYHGSISGMLSALVVYRCLLGFGIGAEYPTSSAAASEASAETKSGYRHAIFIGVTNVAIDLGFILGQFVPYILVLIFSERHLRAVWRLTIGLGVVIPLSIFYFRIKMVEPTSFQKVKNETSTSTGFLSTHGIPYRLIIKRYWVRLLAISVIWFIYDFSAYAFGLFASTITDAVLPTGSSYAKIFGWATLINVFYLPGALLGAFLSDAIGPKYALFIGVLCQAIVGFFMAGFYEALSKNIAAFAVVYGLFLSFGELGPGNNIGLIAAKASCTLVRGRFYAIAAAIGKAGAFAGAYGFTKIASDFGGGTTGNRGNFYVASALAVVAGIVAIVFIPRLDQECIQEEDRAFLRYLEAEGYDVAQLGLKSADSVPDSIVSA